VVGDNIDIIEPDAVTIEKILKPTFPIKNLIIKDKLCMT
jgi:hypothetical protein